jgi:hypothetical protein
MSEVERVAYFLAALVAAFVVAYLTGAAVGPDPAVDEPAHHQSVGAS